MTSDRTVFVVMMNGDRAVRDSLQALLDSMGHTVRIYGSGQEFLTAYETSHRGCLILDVRLSDPSALRFLDDLAAQRIDIPIIITTACDPAAAGTLVMSAGVVAVLGKPFMDELLVDTIEQAFALSRRP